MSKMLLIACIFATVLRARAEIDMGFSMGRTYPTEVGDKNSTLWCRASKPIATSSCTFTYGDASDERILSLDLASGEVKDGTTVQPGYTAYTDAETRLCGLQISSVADSDLGQWRCRVDFQGSKFEQGHIALLNNEVGFVRDVRLPKHVLPSTYDLKLIPFIKPDNYTIGGSININANVVKDGDNWCEEKCIVMHTRDTYINHDSIVIKSDGADMKVEGVAYDLDRDFLIFWLEQPLAPLPVNIDFKFTSLLQDNLAGFYRSQYVDQVSNTTKTIATTQFESTDARRAFPCFDEPAMKANFTVGIGRTKDMATLSNMEKTGNVAIDDEYVMDNYAMSVTMSTYLLAFIVSEFTNYHVEEHPEFNIWSQADRIQEVQYAAEIGPKVVSFYEDLFSTKFPLNKMDMAAIPDFQSGAMENWGLITYRDTAIFYSPEEYAQSSKSRVATVVAHELAHQWFGNLVTMKWWNDLWLNEGFASYIEYLGANEVEPSMNLLEQVVNLDLHDVFYLDALPSSHPISVNIENPVYQENFDRISYGKGCVLIRMMENFLSPAVFRTGLASYFQEHQYSNAEQDDLWKSLNEAANGNLPENITVKSVMDTWTLLKGYPVVNIRTMEDGKWEITQQKFNLEVGSQEGDNSTWMIPVSLRNVDTGDLTDNTIDMWHTVPSLVLDAPADADNSTYLFNIGQMGYYRVNYEPSMWNKLASKFDKLPTLSRAQLYDDALNLARAGQLSYKVALDLTMNLKKESNYVVLKSIKNALTFLQSMMEKDERYPLMKEYLQQGLQNVYDEVSTSNVTDYMTATKRNLVMSWACSLGNTDCKAVAGDLLGQWFESQDSEHSVAVDDKSWVYCAGMESATEEQWDIAWDRLQKTEVILERQSLLTALACPSNHSLLDKYLEKSIDPASTIRAQDKRYVYLAIGASAEGSTKMLDWLTTNWDKIKEFYADTFVYNVKNMVFKYPEFASTQDQFDALNSFLTNHRAELGSSAESVDQSLDKIRANIKWRENYYEDAFDWVTDLTSGVSEVHTSLVFCLIPALLAFLIAH